MNRNQKLAIGCGGAGCLGLIVLIIAATTLYYFQYRRSPVAAERTVDRYNNNSNRGANANTNRDTNRNSNSVNASDNDNDSKSSSSSSSMSDDDKHKLFQAASMSADADLVKRVGVKIGLLNDDYSPRDDYAAFVGAHAVWALQNSEFILTINTPEKARAYVEQHLKD